MNFPNEIKKLRERALLTQTEFADIVGVVFSTVNRWEAGKARPNIRTMKNIKQTVFPMKMLKKHG